MSVKNVILLMINIVFCLFFLATVHASWHTEQCHRELSFYAGPNYDQVNEIVPNLFLGNECEAYGNAHMYGAIVSMSAEHDLTKDLAHRDIRYFRFPLWDSAAQGDDFIRSQLISAAVAIHKMLKKGHRVLVHCQMGKSRSTSAVIAYLLLYHDAFSAKKVHEVWAFVKEKRPIAQPNVKFLDVLETFTD